MRSVRIPCGKIEELQLGLEGKEEKDDVSGPFSLSIPSQLDHRRGEEHHLRDPHGHVLCIGG